MAESLLIGVVSKIGNALKTQVEQILRSQIGHEFSVMFEVQNRLKQIQTELEIMLVFLKQTQNQKFYDEALEVYFKQVRKLAFEIEDVIDEFVYLFEQNHQNETLSLVRNVFNRSKNVSCWYTIALDLKQIQERLKHLQDLKTRYHIELPGEGNGQSQINLFERQTNIKKFSYTFNNKIEPYGSEEETQKLVQLLTIEKKSSSIISIWGLGGSGKTMLARNVFERKNIKVYFDYCIWITISRKYQVQNILLQVAKDLLLIGNKEKSVDKLESLSLNVLVEIIRNNLKERRYLVVLDDMCSVNLWYSLKGIFGEYNSRSSVLITTRIRDVALLASEKYIIPMKTLNDVEAWKLFSRYAFRNMNERKELDNCAKTIVEKCHGLPLAIVIIGNILSCKAPNDNEWREFNNNFYHKSSNNGLSLVYRILNKSYKHLPNHLKNCFLFCTMFPSRYLVHRKRLIRLWVGEGLIEPRSDKLLEEIGEEYLDELINQCLVQVVERNEFGRVRCVKIHGLIRELAIFISQKENFGMNYNNSDVTKIDFETRRLSVCEYTDEFQLGINVTHVRSFLLFHSIDSSLNCIMWVSRNARYLRVLDFQDAPMEYLPNEITYLFNLHYLGLRNTKIKKLPTTIYKLCNLQTLDLFQTEIEKLPIGITKLVRLRHLFAGTVIPLHARISNTIRTTEAPKGLCNLKTLQTIKSIQSSMLLAVNLKYLTKLRTLSLRDVRNNHLKHLSTSIEQMNFLSNLTLRAANENEIVSFESLTIPPQTLRKLRLDGKLSEGMLESVIMKEMGKKLESLTLGWSGLKEDPIPLICCMSNLTSLCLHGAYNGESICFHNGCFPKLKRLCIHGLPSVKRIIIEQLAIQNLECFRLFELMEFDELPQGIEFLDSLKEIYLGKLHPSFIKNFDGAKEKVKHIPIVKYASKNGGNWEVTSLLQTS